MTSNNHHLSKSHSSSMISSYKNRLAFEVNVNDIFEQNEADDIDLASEMSKSMPPTTTSPTKPAKPVVTRLKSSDQPLLSLTAATNATTTTKSLNQSASPTSASAAAFFNSNFDENGYVFDGIKIEIDDIENNSMSNTNTTQSLKRCKSQVLRLYYNLLCFIGWRPFYKSFYSVPWSCSILNVIYPIMIVALLFYSYIYDIVTCQGKLNVALDVQSVTAASILTGMPVNNRTPSTTPKSSTTSTEEMILVTNLVNNTKNLMQTWAYLLGSNNSKNPLFATQNHLNHTNIGAIDEQPQQQSEEKIEQCGHIVTTYIIPSLMHLVSYIMGFIYFRINENEQLYALMEKVFLAVNQSLKIVSQDRVIKRLKIFFFIGVLWVMLAMSLQILFRAAYGFEIERFHPSWIFILLESIALIIMNSINLAVVINHATQCELILFYVHEIKTRLEEKSITLKDAMQQILDIRMAIGNLNSTVSKMTTLVALTFLEKFIIGLIILVRNKVYDPLTWTYRALFPVSWFIILAFTLIQVTRLNSKCGKLKQIALSARVYGYHACSREELDSFILFTANANLRGKLFGIPLKPSYLLGSLLIITFVLIILFQTSTISNASFFI